MIEPLKRELMTARLPRAACSEEMLGNVTAVATEEKTSVAAVIRHAVSLFLSTYNPKRDSNIQNGIKAGDGEEVLGE